MGLAATPRATPGGPLGTPQPLVLFPLPPVPLAAGPAGGRSPPPWESPGGSVAPQLLHVAPPPPSGGAREHLLLGGDSPAAAAAAAAAADATAADEPGEPAASRAARPPAAGLKYCSSRAFLVGSNAAPAPRPRLRPDAPPAVRRPAAPPPAAPVAVPPVSAPPESWLLLDAPGGGGGRGCVRRLVGVTTRTLRGAEVEPRLPPEEKLPNDSSAVSLAGTGEVAPRAAAAAAETTGRMAARTGTGAQGGAGAAEAAAGGMGTAMATAAGAASGAAARGTAGSGALAAALAGGSTSPSSASSPVSTNERDMSSRWSRTRDAVGGGGTTATADGGATGVGGRGTATGAPTG